MLEGGIGRLTTDVVPHSLDLATVSERDFDWIMGVSARLGRSGARLAELSGRRTLALDNYVGVFETPSGTTIEIVPKHVDLGVDLYELRALLLKMVVRAFSPSPRTISEADLRTLRHPLTEWVARQFLVQLDALVKKGVRFDYQRVDEESRFLRCQLDIALQIRQPVDRRHYFRIRHDVFTPDRPENRLLRSALDIVSQTSLSPDLRRLANSLGGFLQEIPPSQDVVSDLARWTQSRLMADYSGVRPWCELIVSGRSPFTQVGHLRGMSLLFPMETLFERYVASCLRERLRAGARLTTQARAEHLCKHKSEHWFMLQPDMVADWPGGRSVLDTKWKIIDESAGSTRDKYGLNQADFYQMFAYGQRYMNNTGDMFLIYPGSLRFTGQLEPFHFSEALRLWAIPFDLATDTLRSDRCVKWLQEWGQPATATAPLQFEHSAF